jgi:integrase
MARQGTRTSHPGILRIDSNRFLVRVTTRHPTTKKRIEKEETIVGRLDHARKRQLEMLDELKTESVRPTTDSPDSRRRAGNAMTLSAFAQLWLAQGVQKQTFTEAYVETRTFYLEKHVLPKLGPVPVAAIDEVVLEDWAGWLASRRQANGKTYAKGTLTAVWATLRSMLTAARSLIGVRVTAAQDFRFRVGGTPARKKETLSPSELRQLLDVIAQEADVGWAAHLWTQAVTGMRHSEVSALRIGDVDLVRRLIAIERAQVNNAVGATKSLKSRRQVPIPDELAPLLARQIGSLDRTAGAETILFPSYDGRHRSVRLSNEKIAEMCRLAGIKKHITTHCFRHTLNDLVRRTAGEVAARSMLGHVTTAMTANYSNVDLEEKAEVQRRALGRLPDPQRAVGSVGMAGGDSPAPVGIRRVL